MRPHRRLYIDKSRTAAKAKEKAARRLGKHAPKNIVEFPVNFDEQRLESFIPPHRPKTAMQALMEAAPFCEPQVSIEERQPLIDVVRQAYSEMSDDDRMLIEAVLFERQSFRQLATRWQIPRSTLHRWYVAALLEMRCKLIEYPEVVAYLDGVDIPMEDHEGDE